MAYLASELITRSFYLSEIVGRDLQVLDQGRLSEGLVILNSLLDFKSTDMALIPYYTEYNFNTVIGQELYFVPNLYLVDEMTFAINALRLPISSLSRRAYQGSVRVNTVQSLPLTFRAERAEGGSNIYLYPLPNQVYPVIVWGKFALTDVTLNEDLTTIYDKFYIEYLRYELASMLCDEWGIVLPDNKMARLESYRKKLMQLSPPDFTCKKISSLCDNIGVDWAFVNLFTGYIPQ